ncbi:hypothetical protein RvY_04358 [Ramazzottius varieornatus]|uniref:Peptidyl-prolyl cis-trans isomerase n=1 Tax=Ramazzottius varieornatus TaxID=947166 RepID=A0A1D1URD4_RAMVA|nr:hypothetical protein RvY_04358 [Ramazzottius varieornatus]
MGDQLPPGWVKNISKSTGKEYYFNTETQESRWTVPTEEEARSARSNQTSQVRASHILAKHRDSRRPSSWRQENITRSKDEALAIIEGYRKQIENGDATFEQIASKYSDCSSAHKGGDLGFFGRGQMQKAFEDVAFGMTTGEISEPFFTESGCHIVLRTG